MFLGESFVHLHLPTGAEGLASDFVNLSIKQPPAPSSKEYSRRRSSTGAFEPDGKHSDSYGSRERSDSEDADPCDICFSSSARGAFETRPSAHRRLLKERHYMSSPDVRDDANFTLPILNFEDFKDVAHKMEDFDKTSERKWVLQYEYVNRESKYRLNKIIVGRGQNNDYPELNNVLLLGVTADFRAASWRHQTLNRLILRNSRQLNNFSLLPSPKTCMSCLTISSKRIASSLTARKPLLRQNAQGHFADVGNGEIDCKVSINPNPVSWRCKILTDLRLSNCRLDHAASVYQRLRTEVRRDEKSKLPLKILWRKQKKQKASTRDTLDGWEPYDVL